MNVIKFSLFLCFFTVLGLVKSSAKEQIITGSVLLQEENAPDFKALVQNMKSKWKLQADSVNISDKTLVFNTKDATIMVAYLDYAIPETDIRAIATLNWQWRTAATDASRHKAQLVISVVGADSRTLSLQKQFSAVAAACIEKAPSRAVYIESQYLLLSSDFYLNAALSMQKDETLPISCWVYVGIMGEAGGNSAYTWGMREFGMPELEIVNSSKSLNEVYAIIYDAALTMIKYNNAPAKGGKYSTLEGFELNTSLSKAKFLEGETLKLEF